MALIPIIAKFNSYCSKCGKAIPKGANLMWDRDNKKVYCAACSGITDQASSDTVTVTTKEKHLTTEVEIDIPKVKKIIDKIVDKETKTRSAGLKKTVDKEIDAAKERVKDELFKEFGAIPKRIIVLEKDGKVVKKIAEITHEKFADIVLMVTANVPVFLRGEAGCGKNHMVQQIAKALGLEFYFSNAITNEYKVTGFIDANGHFHETQFYEAFSKGGLFFFDEIDASIPEVLVLLNAAIENKYFNFPIGKVDAHPDFRIIAAGNTFGSGATQTYVGRYQLDGASLDRFAVVDITYDEQVEMIIADGDKELVQSIHKLRDITREAGIKIILSYRAINQITKLHTQKGLPINDVLKYTILKGMSIDDMNIIKPKIKGSDNKYLKAMYEVMNV